MNQFRYVIAGNTIFFATDRGFRLICQLPVAFMIKDKTDPCGFAYISNKAGVIYSAELIR